MIRTVPLALVLSACGVPEDLGSVEPVVEAHSESLTSPTAVVRVSSSGEAPMHYAKHFEIAESDFVYFVAQISASNGMHTAAFEVFDADANPYQRLSVPFEVTANAGEPVARLPVNGTWISQFNMTGQWTCRLSIDSDSTELAHVAFILR